MNDMTMDRLTAYRAMCAAKRIEATPRGMTNIPALNTSLFDHQAHGVLRATASFSRSRRKNVGALMDYLDADARAS